MVSDRFRRSALQRGALFKDASKRYNAEGITTIGVLYLTAGAQYQYDMVADSNGTYLLDQDGVTLH
jgi:iron complex outermembrane receptor protein